MGGRAAFFEPGHKGSSDEVPLKDALFFAPQNVAFGPSRHFAAAQQTVAFGGIVLQKSFLIGAQKF
jgi:hypothetical protein